MMAHHLKASGNLPLSGVVCSLVVMLALLNTTPASAEALKSAESLLQEMGPALAKTSYRGVFVYGRGDQVSSMQVVHRYNNNRVEERLVLQDGNMGEIVRHGQRVFCVLPSGGSMRLDAVISTSPFADAFSGQWKPIGRWYSAERVADDRVAGHGAAVVAVNPRDEHRYRYRLWLEKNTGLLVKSEVLARDDDVLERFQFTMLKLTTEFDDEEFEIQSTAPAKEVKLKKIEAAQNGNQLSGWQVAWRPDGFSPVSAPKAPHGETIAFSDGLASFSVFVRPLNDMDMPTGVSRIGATTVFMRKLKVADKMGLVTVVGEIPPETAIKIAESVRFTDPERAPIGRL